LDLPVVFSFEELLLEGLAEGLGRLELGREA
jgi:hypothetical protein